MVADSLKYGWCHDRRGFDRLDHRWIDPLFGSVSSHSPALPTVAQPGGAQGTIESRHRNRAVDRFARRRLQRADHQRVHSHCNLRMVVVDRHAPGNVSEPPVAADFVSEARSIIRQLTRTSAEEKATA